MSNIARVDGLVIRYPDPNGWRSPHAVWAELGPKRNRRAVETVEGDEVRGGGDDDDEGEGGVDIDVDREPGGEGEEEEDEEVLDQTGGEDEQDADRREDSDEIEIDRFEDEQETERERERTEGLEELRGGQNTGGSGNP